MDIGRIGIWTHNLDVVPYADAAAAVRRLGDLGFGCVWIPEALGKHPLVHAATLLAASERIVVATGIANIYARDAITMAAGQKTLTEAHPDRFLLGIGVSHQPMVEGMRGHDYSNPYGYLRDYLTAMANAPYLAAGPTTEPKTVVGALGPQMTKLAAKHTWGVHPYNVTVDHTRATREFLGDGPLIAPEQAVVLETDPDEARRIAREQHLRIYLGLPNYENNLLNHGFERSDFENGGSDRLVDTLVPWGSPADVAPAIQAHLDAGADHVAVQVISQLGGPPPVDQWAALAAEFGLS